MIKIQVWYFEFEFKNIERMTVSQMKEQIETLGSKLDRQENVNKELQDAIQELKK
jgi:hypothetical protein